jgi:hypothetical protein
MDDLDHLRALAARWATAAERTAGRADAVAGLGAVAWRSGAAEAFRAQLTARAAGLRAVADAQGEVTLRVHELARAVATAEGRARHAAPRGTAPW